MAPYGDMLLAFKHGRIHMLAANGTVITDEPIDSAHVFPEIPGNVTGALRMRDFIYVFFVRLCAFWHVCFLFSNFYVLVCSKGIPLHQDAAGTASRIFHGHADRRRLPRRPGPGQCGLPIEFAHFCLDKRAQFCLLPAWRRSPGQSKVQSQFIIADFWRAGKRVHCVQHSWRKTVNLGIERLISSIFRGQNPVLRPIFRNVKKPVSSRTVKFSQPRTPYFSVPAFCPWLFTS